MDDTPIPTQTRYKLLGYLGALTFILYLDRVCIGKAALSIEKDLDLSHTQMGYVFGAFTIAYGLFEVPTGRWGDRFGSRGVLTRIVIWWSLFTVLTGCVGKFAWDSGYRLSLGFRNWSVPLLFDSFILLMLIRFLFGAGEAGALPNVARVVARWYPLKERSLVQGVILTCMQLGGAISPLLATYLIQRVEWRSTFYIFGSTGVVWAVAFYRWFRDDPAEHPGVNRAERELIAGDPSLAPRADAHPPIPWKLIFVSRNAWLLGSIMTCSAAASYMYMFWLPTYLEKARGLSPDQSGYWASMVLAGGAIGSFAGGYFSGRVTQWTGERRWSRRGLGAMMLILAGLCLAMSVRCDSPEVAASLVALAATCGLAHQANWWAITMDISGRHLGALFGLLNSMGVPGAFFSPIFLGAFVDWRKEQGFLGRDQWDPAFYLYALVLVIGAGCYLLVDATRPVEGKEEVEEPAT